MNCYHTEAEEPRTHRTQYRRRNCSFAPSAYACTVCPSACPRLAAQDYGYQAVWLVHCRRQKPTNCRRRRRELIYEISFQGLSYRSIYSCLVLSLAKIFGPFWKQTYVVAESTIPENVWKHRLLPENRGAVMATTRDAVNLPSTVGHYVISETVAIRGGNPAMHSKSEYRAHVVNLLYESGTLTGRRGRICGCHTSKNTRESHIYIYMSLDADDLPKYVRVRQLVHELYFLQHVWTVGAE